MTDFIYRPHNRIEPLSGESMYNLWVVRIRGILKDTGLWEYASGEKTRPEPAEGQLFTTTEDQSKWDVHDGHALTSIQQRVTDNVLTYILECTTSAEAWN